MFSLIFLKKPLFCCFGLPEGYPEIKLITIFAQTRINIIFMANKKEIRSDNTYLISRDSTDNPKLGAKILSDGRESLFLDFYFGTEVVFDAKKCENVTKKLRKRVFITLYLLQAPRTPLERQQNKETLELAKKLRFEEGQKLLEDLEGYRLRKNIDINFLDYFQAYINKYTKKDIRTIVIALRRFIDFLNDTPEYNKFSKKIKPQQITREMMQDFTEYLQGRSKGEGARSIYKRFKKVIKYAVDNDIIAKNPCNGISIKVDDNLLKKEVLSIEEYERLTSTNSENQNQEVRRAFIFCLYTGLRYCDVKDLTFENVDYSNRLLKFEQNKTKGHSASSGVVIPLNDGLIRLIGLPKHEDDREELIFKLPSYEMCSKSLKRWVESAGINKHITWHCARHSFALNTLNNGANPKTVSSLLGHSGLKCTEKYLRAVDSLKEQAINSLPELKF